MGRETLDGEGVKGIHSAINAVTDISAVQPDLKLAFGYLSGRSDVRGDMTFDVQIANVDLVYGMSSWRRLSLDLIGGVSIRVGDEVMDASVRGKLQKMASALKV